MFSIQDIRQRRQAIVECAKRHGAVRIRIFGSLSRGEERPGSDVDFLVRYEPDRSLIDHIALIESLASLLQVPVDVVSEAGLSPHLREAVLRDAVDL